MPCHWASANLDLSLSRTELSSRKHITCTASKGKECSITRTLIGCNIYLLYVFNQESLPSTCKTLLSDSSPVLTSTFSKMHFLAVALVYAAADSSKDSDTLFTGEIKPKGNKLAPRLCCQWFYTWCFTLNSCSCVNKSALSPVIFLWLQNNIICKILG